MRWILALLVFLISLPVVAQQTVINDGNAVKRDVAAFTGIKVSGAFSVYLSQSDNYSLAVSASDTSIINDIKTEVKDNVLHIYVDNFHWKRHWHNVQMRVYISFKTLESIDVSGACGILLDGTVNATTMLVRLSGASTIEGNIKAGTLSFELSGASVSKVAGDAENIKIDASGASDIKNYDLKTQNCVAKLSGASDARLSISNSLVVSASGASTLFYDGNPEKRSIEKSGASSVLQKGN